MNFENCNDMLVLCNYRAVVAPSGAIHGECRILEPVTIELAITRNLSIGWYKDRPEIDITGTMEAVMVRFFSPIINDHGLRKFL